MSISYLIRQSFPGYRCKSDVAIFAWRVTCNYAYSPFNLTAYFYTILKLRIFKLGKYFHGATCFSNQNLRQIGQGFPEL